MAIVNYYIRCQKNKGRKTSAYIYVRLSIINNYKFSTGIRLHSASSWNKKSKEVRKIKIEPNAKLYNQTLRKFEVYFLNEYKKLIVSENSISKINVKNIYLSFKQTEKLMFNTLFEEFIMLRKTSMLKKNGAPYMKRTIQNYGSTFKLMKAYQKENGYIDLKKINIEFYNQLLHFLKTTTHLKRSNKKQLVLFKTLKKENRYSESYIEKVVSTLKSYFTYLINVKKISLPEYSHKEWS